jgi:hypothetical protein
MPVILNWDESSRLGKYLEAEIAHHEPKAKEIYQQLGRKKMFLTSGAFGWRIAFIAAGGK